MTVSMPHLLAEARAEIQALEQLWTGKVQPQPGETSQQAVERLRAKAHAHAKAACARLQTAADLTSG